MRKTRLEDDTRLSAVPPRCWPSAMPAACFMLERCLCGDSLPFSARMSSAPLWRKRFSSFARRFVPNKRTAVPRSGHQRDGRKGGVRMKAAQFQFRPILGIAATVVLPAVEGVAPEEGRG